MIEGNVIKFGYGDIVVTVCEDVFATVLIFEQIAPSLICGSSVNLVEGDISFGTTRTLTGRFEDFNEFLKQLELVHERKTNVFAFKDLVFDFTKYHPTSVKVMIDKAKAAIQKTLMCYAV